jgi:hypothetical protein
MLQADYVIYIKWRQSLNYFDELFVFGFAHLTYAKLKCKKNKSGNRKTKARNS